MILISLRAFYAIAAIGGMCFSTAHAQNEAPSPEELQRWFDSEWAASREPLNIDGFKLTWKKESYRLPSREQVEQFRSAVAAAPDHPGRAELALLERRLAGAPDVTTLQLWMKGAAEWRLSRTHESENDPYADSVVTRDHSWGMTPRQLVVIDPAKGYPSGYDYSRDGGWLQLDVGVFAFGGLDRGRALEVKPGPIERTETGWQASAVADNGTVFFYRGTWSAEHARGFVDEVRIQRSPVLDGVYCTLKVSGWQFDAEWKRWRASRAEERMCDGKLDLVYSLVECAPYDAATFERVTAIPDLAGVDEVRGAVTFVGIQDFRPSVPVVRTTKDGAEVLLPHPAAQSLAHANSIRQAGWVVAAVLIAAIVASRIRRRKSSDQRMVS